MVETIPVNQKCKLCDKIDVKTRRRAREEERISRWSKEGGRLSAGMDKSTYLISCLDSEIGELRHERERRLVSGPS